MAKYTVGTGDSSQRWGTTVEVSKLPQHIKGMSWFHKGAILFAVLLLIFYFGSTISPHTSWGPSASSADRLSRGGAFLVLGPLALLIAKFSPWFLMRAYFFLIGIILLATAVGTILGLHM